jgi:hypothetical protein
MPPRAADPHIDEPPVVKEAVASSRHRRILQRMGSLDI